METVILRSDIARLVLRYLQDQHLSSVSRQFCKSSPYLKEEFDAYKHGLQAHCFFPTLEEIICEYVKILQKVDHFIPTLPENVQIGLRQLSLSEKINEILQIQKDTKHFKLSESVNNQSSSTGDENAANALQTGKVIKRKRKISTPYHESASETEHIQKKRRVVQKYYYLNSKHKSFSDKTIESTADETSESNEHDQSNNTAIDIDILKLDIPKSESTPHNKLPKPKVLAKTLPEITQAILENDEFQKKLVSNINDALNSAEKTNENSKQIDTDKTSSENQISPSQLLDEMVKNILEATERDPTFDAIIQEVVGAPNSKTEANDTEQAVSNSFGTANNLPGSLPAVLPRTPLIIRNANVATTTAANSDTNAVSRPVSQTNSNNLLHMFADSSFSITRLVNINANESGANRQGQADQSMLSIGNSTADHILSHLAANVGTEGTAALTSSEEQIISDIGNGPLFPVYINNDGTVTPITYILNGNEISLGNQILAAPIVLTSALDSVCEKTNNAPIILNSGSKTVASNAKEVINKDNGDAISINIEVLTENPDAVENGTTPTTSGIVNKKISKSFSTPRRRTTPSHIRALTFSPASNAVPLVRTAATPLSTRRSIQTSNTICDSNKSAEKPIIRNVEILPQLPIETKTAAATTTSTTVTTAALCNESSNSCSVPPLFAAEENSNQTVIKTELSVSEKNQSTGKNKVAQRNSNVATENTPKRKQSRRTAARRCKRQLSKSSNEEETEVEAKTSPKPKNAATTTTINKLQSKDIPLPPSTEEVSKKEITLEDWKKLRSCTNSDLDARLREINARKIETVQPAVKRQTKKKKSRAKRLIGSKNNVSNVSKAAADSAADEEEEDEEEEEKKKLDLSTSISESNPSAEKQKNAKNSANLNDDDEQNNKAPTTTTTTKAVNVTAEVERRMSNIGYLLETPFKDATNGVAEVGVGFVPPTPGVFLPTLDTPHSKTKDYDELRESATFLFGSLTKSELGTPQLSAITPGFRFTPLVAKDANTPHSVTPTEYSSGGSYYRPDESEDLDRNFDKLLRDSVQKKLAPEIGAQQQFDNESEIVEIVEIPTETLKVAPIVLRRVKSFGQEGGTTETTENDQTNATEFAVDPHYTLASGLPMIYLEKEEAAVPISASTASSSTSSNSTCSSSTSSSSADSSTSSDSDTDAENAATHKAEETVSPRFLSLENLSDISSADDDEDWQKMESKEKSNSMHEEKLELIDNHGEVRFPVRSWLTPRKAVEASATISSSTTNVIKMTLKSAEKVNRQAELVSKRERMKEKLKQDIAPKVKTKVQRRQSTVQTSTKAQKPIAKQELSSTTELINKPTEKEAATVVDVLTALQLSAKKTSLPTSSSSLTNTEVDNDDNAVSNVVIASKDVKDVKDVTKAIMPGISSKTTMKSLFPSLMNHQGPRKCVPIEALPAIKSSSRVTSKSTKQIVRTPLGFKGTSAGVANLNSTNANKSSAIIKTGSKPKIKIAPTTIGCASRDKVLSEKVRVSPRLQTSEKSQKLKEPPNKALKATTTKNQQAAKKPKNKGNLKKPENKNAASTVKQEICERATKQTTEVAPINRNRNRKQKPETNIESITHNSAAIITTKVEKSMSERELNKSIPTTSLPTPPTLSYGDRFSAPERPSPPSADGTEARSRHLNTRPVGATTTTTTPATPPTPPTTENKQKNKATFHQIKDLNKSADEADDSDDPLEDCTRVTLSENDKHCYFNYIHDDENLTQIKMPTSPNTISNELKKFQLHVAFDGNTKHTWRISQDFCLFTQTPNAKILKSPTPPQSIRNIPKKRRVCTISSSPINNDEVDSGVNKSGHTKSKNVNSTQSDLLTEESTENKQKENNSQILSTDPSTSTTKNIHLSSNPSVPPLSLSLTSATTVSTDKIQIGDIESILSQLHDSENTEALT